MKAIIFLVILFLSGSVLAQGNTGYSFEEKYPVSGPARLHISSFDGHIEVVSGNSTEILVYYIATRNGKVLDLNRQELAKEVDLEVEANGAELRISVRSRYETKWLDFGNDNVNVSFRIVAPQATSSDLHSSDGHISISGLNGDQTMKTSDGHIHIENVVGQVKGNTSDGNIRVNRLRGDAELGSSDGHITITEALGNLTLSTSDGNIELQKIAGDISARSSDGHIHFSDLTGSLRARTSDGGIKGNFIELHRELSLHTGDGSISITLPSLAGLTLDIKGESLNVPLADFTGTSDEHRIQGMTAGGGIPVSLHTTEGSVTVTRL